VGLILHTYPTAAQDCQRHNVRHIKASAANKQHISNTSKVLAESFTNKSNDYNARLMIKSHSDHLPGTTTLYDISLAFHNIHSHVVVTV